MSYISILPCMSTAASVGALGKSLVSMRCDASRDPTFREQKCQSWWVLEQRFGV